MTNPCARRAVGSDGNAASTSTPDEIEPNQMTKASSVVRLSRQPKENVRILLFTLAGGRCEFDNCNRYLLTHHVTHRTGKFAQMAHIVAFHPAGPRGEFPLNPAERNDISNLMLLCPQCHKLIDDNPDLYPVGVLQRFKKDHGDRIRMLTAVKADKQTSALVLKAVIGSSPVAIPLADMQSAVAPSYLDQGKVHSIELPSVTERRTEAYWQSSVETIHGHTERFYASLRQTGFANIAVFALAPIPLLVALGSCLSNKFPTSLFQRHRDTDDWRWKEDDDPVEFNCGILHEGTDPHRVALVCSLSGAVPPADYPSAVDGSFTVYRNHTWWHGTLPRLSAAPGELGGIPCVLQNYATTGHQRASRRAGDSSDSGSAGTCSRGHGAGSDAKGTSLPRCVRQAWGRGFREDDRGGEALGPPMTNSFSECAVHSVAT